MKRDRVIVFARYPKPGRAKTRLIPRLGERGAAELSRQLAEHTLKQAEKFCQKNDAALEVRFEGGDEVSMKEWLGHDFMLSYQDDGDLGDRMCHAFEDAFCEGVKRAVIIGTDCPEIDRSVIRNAFTALEDHDLVLGPANDGGYYLIGLKKNIPQLFENMKWGSDQVLEQTRRTAKSINVSTKLLPVLSDVDRPEDLSVWDEVRNKPAIPYISVVIPVFNEHGHVYQAIDSARASDDVEIIVVDGGSTDGTVDAVRQKGAGLVTSHPGRACQMNAGAEVAGGEVLLFLHADSILPRDYVRHVRNVMDEPGVVGGAFALRFDGRSLLLRILERTASFRSKSLRMPYGDQGIFVSAEVFRELGGFPDFPLMDDFEFVRRLRRKGRVLTVDAAVVTSSRRYEIRGTLRTTLLNQLIILAYYLGVSPERLARWYNR